MAANGLLHLPQHGALAAHSEAAIVATIEQLVRDRRLVRTRPQVSRRSRCPARAAQRRRERRADSAVAPVVAEAVAR